MEVDGLAFDELDRLAPHGAHHVVFADALGHRRAGAEAERRLPADRDRDRHLLVAGRQPRGGMMADMLGAPHQDRNLVARRQHAAIDADIHHPGRRVLGHHARIGDEIAAAVEPVPVRHREVVEIDVLAGDDVLLDRAGLDDPRRDRALENVAADLDQFARMGVGRQAQHDGDAPIVVERGAEHAPAAAVRLVVVLDVVEQHRPPGAGPLRQPHDGAELDVPIHLRIDLLQLVVGAQRLDPAAQITESNRLAFNHSSPFISPVVWFRPQCFSPRKRGSFRARWLERSRVKPGKRRLGRARAQPRGCCTASGARRQVISIRLTPAAACRGSPAGTGRPRGRAGRWRPRWWRRCRSRRNRRSGCRPTAGRGRR